MKEIKREIYKILEKEFAYPEITILLGARQVGKTFLMKKLLNYAQKKGVKARFYDLEQPDTLLSFNQSDKDIIQMLTQNTEVVFIDEFYYFKNASHVFKAIYDKEYKVKIFASSSSSLEIHKHLKESLAGRKRIFKIYPCNYTEMNQVWARNCFSNVINYGGLPGITKCNDPNDIIMLLSDIHQSYILKDVKSLIKEENIRAFNNLIYLLAVHQGSVISVSNLAREIGLTPKSVDNYLNILSHTGVLFPIFSFSRNMGNELKKSRKYYLYDLGIRNMIVKDFRDAEEREDRGFLYESFVFLELAKMLDPVSEIRFWRTKDGKEVDFIFVKNRVPFPIEVKTHINPGEIPSGLMSFLKRYPKTQKAFIFNLKYIGETSYKNTRIFYKNTVHIQDFKDWI